MHKLLSSLALLLLTASIASAQDRLGRVDERATSARVRALIDADHRSMSFPDTPAGFVPQVAPIPIKHPQKAAYENGEPGPLFSAQSHWLGANGHIQHTHVECWSQPWRHTTLDAFTVPCQLQTFHLSGRVTSLWVSWVGKVEWQSSGGGWVEQTSAAPPIPVEGDPHGAARVYPLRITFDPKRAPGLDNNPDTNPLQSGINDIPWHGYWHGVVSAETRFDDGAVGDTTLYTAYWSVADTTKTVEWWNSEFQIGTSGNLNAPGVPLNAFGKSISYYTNANLPVLGPLDTPVFINMGGSAYGVSPDLPPGFVEGFLNPDLHNGVTGTQILSVSGRGSAGGTVLIDPAMLSDGVNRLSMTWRQPTTGATPGMGFVDGLEFTTLFVVPLLKGSGSTPPPPPPPAQEICGDGIDNDKDGQIDEGCAPPPPPPTWETVPGAVIQRQGDLWRLLFPDGKFSQPQPVQ